MEEVEVAIQLEEESATSAQLTEDTSEPLVRSRAELGKEHFGKRCRDFGLGEEPNMEFTIVICHRMLVMTQVVRELAMLGRPSIIIR